MKSIRKNTGERKLHILRDCLSLIEKKANLGPFEEWTSKDYENLSLLIERETRVLISVSTLRRLWKAEFKGSPQTATMDALAKYAGFADWLSFTQESQLKQKRSGAPKPFKTALIYILAAITVLSVAALWYFNRLPAGGDQKSDTIVLQDHLTGPESGVMSTTGDARVLGKPMEHSDILAGNLGWNAVVYTEKGPVTLDSHEFIGENGLDISSYLGKLERRRHDYSNIHYYYIGDFKGLDAAGLNLSGSINRDAPLSSMNKSTFNIELITDQTGIEVRLDPGSAMAFTQIGDTTFTQKLASPDIIRQSGLSFQMESKQNTLVFHLNSEEIIYLDQVMAKGELFAISILSDHPFALSNVIVHSSEDSSLAIQILD